MDCTVCLRGLDINVLALRRNAHLSSAIAVTHDAYTVLPEKLFNSYGNILALHTKEKNTRLAHPVPFLSLHLSTLKVTLSSLQTYVSHLSSR